MIIVPQLPAPSPGVLPGESAPPAASHRLPTAVSAPDAAARRFGAMFMGFSRELTQDEQLRSFGASREYRRAIMIKRILDHALVKDAVTALHQEHDAHLEKIAAAGKDALQTMLKDEEAFLREQETRYAARFTDERQRMLFRTMTADYFTEAMERAKQLRDRMVIAYQRDVIGRQNQEFVNRALSDDIVFHDALQTSYRDLLLYNLDMLHAELPEKERALLQDEACRDFYRQIMEKRLELDPARLDTMLRSPSVKRVLGPAVVREYTGKAAAAVRDDRLSATARQWVDDAVSPSEAKRLAAALPEKDRTRALELYRYWRLQDGRRRFLELVVVMEQGWRAIAEGGYRDAAIPARVRRNHPHLDALFRHCLARRRQNGGLPPEADYSRLADLVCDHQPAQWAEILSQPERACKVVARLGGPESAAFQAGLRFLIGKATEEDGRMFTDLRLARRVWQRQDPDDAKRRQYCADFVKKRRIHMEREKRMELQTEEVAALAESCLAV